MNSDINLPGRLSGASKEAPIRDIIALAGAPTMHSRWITIDQGMIDRFAELTNDHNWLHVDPERAAKSVVGGTIAHGFLTLSLIATMAYDVLPKVAYAKMGMNYGLNKLRFIAPVPSGSRVRGAFALTSATTKKDGSRTEMLYRVEIQIEGSDKPALMAEWIRVAIF
jgi:acyl dehydratase